MPHQGKRATIADARFHPVFFVPRIIYTYPFGANVIAGGIKVGYQHVALLQRAGYDAAVFQPEGRASWFQSTVEVIAGRELTVGADDILVIPEGLGLSRELIAGRRNRLFMFCQNQHYVFHELISDRSHYELGIERIYTCGVTTKRFLERVFGYTDIGLIPHYIDKARFARREKKVQIAFMSRKLPAHARLIRNIFQTKFPEYKSVPWRDINGVSESETAEIMSTSLAFLALSHQESQPLPPLEAMASGCAVVGFHGMGALEYATKDNGIWLFSDEVEEAADGLYRCIKGLETGDALVTAMVKNGEATARRYDIEQTNRCLLEFFAGAI